MKQNHLGKTCPYCNLLIETDSNLALCSSCGASHHKECWDKNGKCANSKCQSKLAQADDPGLKESASKKNMGGLKILLVVLAVIIISQGFLVNYILQNRTTTLSNEEVVAEETADERTFNSVTSEADKCHIVFITEQNRLVDIYIMDLESNQPIRLTSDSGNNGWPRFSPDGSRIIFTSDRNGPYELFIMLDDGSNQTRLSDTDADFETVTPNWSPDGSKIIFASDRDVEGRRQIYKMDVDGSNLTRLTDSTGLDSNPAWSPCGTKIAFVSDRYLPGIKEIYIMDSDGNNPTRLTYGGYNCWAPLWSPDGSKIAFESYRNEKWGVYIIDADGENETLLTDEGIRGSGNPGWSPDGSKIVFWSDRDGTNEIFIMNADGSEQSKVNLGHLEGFSSFGPKFSPRCVLP